jgi:hypothetical protein
MLQTKKRYRTDSQLLIGAENITTEFLIDFNRIKGENSIPPEGITRTIHGIIGSIKLIAGLTNIHFSKFSIKIYYLNNKWIRNLR